MTIWVGFVDALEALLFVLTQAFGGNLAWAIVAFSLGVRIALLPLTYRIARETQANRVRLLALRPDLENVDFQDVARFRAIHGRPSPVSCGNRFDRIRYAGCHAVWLHL